MPWSLPGPPHAQTACVEGDQTDHQDRTQEEQAELQNGRRHDGLDPAGQRVEGGNQADSSGDERQPL